MKTDFSKLPREEVEARITTMLLGEMPVDQMAELMEFVSGNSELLRLHDELKRTISLVEEATVASEPVRLSPGRREALLESFKMVRPPELVEKSAAGIQWRNWGAMAAMVGLLLGGAVFVFNPIAARKPGQMASVAERGGEELKKRSISVPSDPSESFHGNPAQGHNSTANTKIELPRLADSESKRQAQSQPWGFTANLRGFADIDQSANTQLAPGTPVELGRQYGAADKTTPKVALGLDANTTPSAIDALTGLPMATPGKDMVADSSLAYRRAPAEPAASALEKPATQPAVGDQILTEGLEAPAKGEAVAGIENQQMGGMGGESVMSMQYYLANPELMKRYFPQMYSQMQKGGGAGATSHLATSGGTAGFPGAPVAAWPETDDEKTDRNLPPAQVPPPLATAGLPDFGQGMDRHRVMQMPSAATAKPAQDAGKNETAINAKPPTEISRLTVALDDADTKKTANSPETRKSGAANENRNSKAQADAIIPKDSGVRILQEAESGGSKRTVLGALLGRSEERVTRLEVAKDAREMTPLAPAQQSASYDPYFLQTEAEKIRSQRALGEVVDELKLDQKWGEAEGRKLNRDEAIERLGKVVTVAQQPNSSVVEIHARGDNGAEAAQVANKVAEVYRKDAELGRAKAKNLTEQEKQIAQKEEQLVKLRSDTGDLAARKPVSGAPIPQPEVSTAENAFSTFSLNVSDVSFKLAAASLEKGLMPEATTVRSEEFINAFDYRDPEPQGVPIGFVWERARFPFAQDRDLLRFSVKTAASGRQAGRPLNLVLLLDSSGSMERADRVRILQECMKTLAAQLRPEDKVSVVAFARTARLWVDGLPGTQARELPQRVGNLTPEGGTNLEEAMKIAYETARRHFSTTGINRVVLLTDGAANLGDVEPESLKRKVEEERKKGIALDCFGIGWEGLNDDLLETMSRNGDGRYGFVNTPEAAGGEFAAQLAGALHVAASDVKVQVEFNSKRVTAYRQVGYAKHQLTKEQFRDDTVDAAELGAAEAGNALYIVQVNTAGEGPIGMVRVRFKVPGTNDYREHEWPLNYDGASKALETSSYPLRLAGTASAFSEWLAANPYASEVTTDRLLTILSGVPEHFEPDSRPKKLEWMIRQAKSLAGK